MCDSKWIQLLEEFLIIKGALKCFHQEAFRVDILDQYP